MELADRVAVVTGGASGLGRATALELVRSGARVAVLDLNERAAKELAADHGPKMLAVEADVSEPLSVATAMNSVEAAFERVDICVNAAAVATSGKVVSQGKALPLAEFRHAIDVNLVGAFDVMRRCAERMARNDPGPDGERGVVINVSSAAATQGQVGQAAYAASKAGLHGLMLPAARDLAPLGIRIVTIAPGLFDTPMASAVSDKAWDGMLRLVLNPRRPGRPEEFASVVRHTIENDYINATSFAIDGGIRLQ